MDELILAAVQTQGEPGPPAAPQCLSSLQEVTLQAGTNTEKQQHTTLDKQSLETPEVQPRPER